MDEKERLLKPVRQYFESGATREPGQRTAALRRLHCEIGNREHDIEEALRLDFGKGAVDTYLTEILMTLEEIDVAIRHLRRWSRPKRASVGLANFPARGKVYAEPFGVVLVISPWNYPFLLAMAPLVGAVAAGNCVALKVSAQTPHTSRILTEIVRAAFEDGHAAVFEGGHEICDRLIEEKPDMVFFTGSAAVGRRIMEKASRNLIPVVLELGGKSPCIVDETADLDEAARRIAWGKFLNAGQTCVAPDYILAQDSIKEELQGKLIKWIQKLWYQEGRLSDQFPSIISERHFDRLMGLCDGGRILCGGGGDRPARKIEPTVLTDVTPDSALMQEEIFGPVLPVLSCQNMMEAIQFVNDRPKPLALYFFSRDKKAIRQIIRETSSGGACINNTVMHLTSSHLPFGGVGESGMGKYHGKYSFDTFSNRKAVLFQPAKWEMRLKYPPHKEDKIKTVKRLLRK
ncbi:MAG: aldehyde dehydrogenase family protein [Clostridiales bacterium]|nr:aldehyde dehydrogenase family protein [Clostridiales bacterium]